MGTAAGAGDGGASHLSDGDLIAWSDGTAADRRADRMAAHLVSCADCRRRLAEFREAGELLRERYPLVDDPTARARIVAQTSGRAKAGRPRARSKPAISVLTAAWLAVAGAGARIGRSTYRRLRRTRRKRPDE